VAFQRARQIGASAKLLSAMGPYQMDAPLPLDTEEPPPPDHSSFFRMIVKRTRTCPHCRRPWSVWEGSGYFKYVSRMAALPVGISIELTTCLDLVLFRDRESSDNYLCSDCLGDDASSTQSSDIAPSHNTDLLTDLPAVMFMDVKRYSVRLGTATDTGAAPRPDGLDFPLELDLSRHRAPMRGPQIYELYSTVNHVHSSRWTLRCLYPRIYSLWGARRVVASRRWQAYTCHH